MQNKDIHQSRRNVIGNAFTSLVVKKKFDLKLIYPLNSDKIFMTGIV